MKKMLSLSPLVLLGLSFSACVDKQAIPTTPTTPTLPTVQSATPAVIVTRQTESTSLPIQVTIGEQHQLKTVQGSIIHIEERSNGFFFPQYKGKVVLLQLFGKKCKYCEEEIPFIKSMQRKYEENLNIVAIQAQDVMDKETAKSVLQKFQMNYPVIDRDEANNLLFFIKSTYGWTGILPYMFLVKDGVTEYSFSGKVNHQEFEESIRNIL